MMETNNENKEKLKLYTWNEVSKHNQKNDLWIIVDGKVYNITKWVPLHPGGEDILLLSAGRDATNLFESYHPMTDKHYSLIKQYEIGYISSYEHPKYVEKSEFYSTLKQRVRKHFQTSSQDPKVSVGVFTRMVLIYLFLFVTYYLSQFSTDRFWLNCLFAILYGVANSLFGLHTMHDACHTAITHNPMTWKILGATFDLFTGASFYAWCHQHVIGHHLYTNVRNADPDLGQGEIDFRVVTPYQARSWYHKYQHIYAPILYGVYALKYRIQDHEIFTKKSNGSIRYSPISTIDTAIFILGKLVFIISRFILPLIYNHSFSHLICFFLISELVLGWYLAISFQVSHVVEELQFLATPEIFDGADHPLPTTFNQDWAILQVKTTQDYAQDSVLSTFFSGGLNLQVIHHCFPTIAQDFYPQIVPILKEVCKEYNVTYHYKPTFAEAIKSHINYLYKMGNDPDYVRKPVNKND
ncbi:hypothetical protein ACTFIY_007767 [Dictyostelium cf. discoideum]